MVVSPAKLEDLDGRKMYLLGRQGAENVRHGVGVHESREEGPRLHRSRVQQEITLEGSEC